MNLKPNTTVVNKHIVFHKDDAGWYADMEGTRARNAWLCNQTHRFIGGEHPKDIFVHAIINN